MKTAGLKSVFAALLVLATTSVMAQEAKVYSEGPITTVTEIKIKPGMFDAYMKWLATERKALMEEYKKAGLILSWKVYGAEARNPRDADLILTVTYKNWAALDGLEDKQEPIAARLQGSNDKQNQAAVSREQMREVLGSQTIQELVIK
jgi:hypothetical protein